MDRGAAFITGRDGSYPTESRLAKDYEVRGSARPVAMEDPTHHLGPVAQMLRGNLEARRAPGYVEATPHGSALGLSLGAKTTIAG
ncbi:MAG TPA: hypothetical protein VNY05_11140 [Candidatus Acidoferrales bacterium]|jgi:hypothetical protein|nr:hypothetical protein [Candidatus Acidoferrales bacterium]